MENSKRYCLTLDLKTDPAAIEAYDDYHQRVWPAVIDSLRAAGILEMEIYRYGNRLCMIMETTEGFSLEAKAAADQANPRVQEWERLMEKYQQPFEGIRNGKWMQMASVFTLSNYK